MRVKSKCESCGRVLLLLISDEDPDNSAIADLEAGEYFENKCPLRAAFEKLEGETKNEVENKR